MFTNNREAYRQSFFDAWQKYQKNLPLEKVEMQLVEVISIHPEYHHWFSDINICLHQEFEVEENPFLHMSLHVAIREQIQLDRPAGVKNIYHQLLANSANEHEAEHQMMACLGEILAKAQLSGEIPDEKEYLERLKTLSS